MIRIFRIAKLQIHFGNGNVDSIHAKNERRHNAREVHNCINFNPCKKSPTHSAIPFPLLCRLISVENSVCIVRVPHETYAIPLVPHVGHVINIPEITYSISISTRWFQKLPLALSTQPVRIRNARRRIRALTFPGEIYPVHGSGSVVWIGIWECDPSRKKWMRYFPVSMWGLWIWKRGCEWRFLRCIFYVEQVRGFVDIYQRWGTYWLISIRVLSVPFKTFLSPTVLYQPSQCLTHRLSWFCGIYLFLT